jgi:hypothetical protein
MAINEDPVRGRLVWFAEALLSQLWRARLICSSMSRLGNRRQQDRRRGSIVTGRPEERDQAVPSENITRLPVARSILSAIIL